MEDRLESVVVDVDGGSGVLAGVAFLCSVTSTDSSSDSLSDESGVSAYIMCNGLLKIMNKC